MLHCDFNPATSLCTLQLKKLRIHEDPNGGIYIAGVTSQRVESVEEVLTIQ